MQVNIIISKNVTSEWRVICRTLWVPMMNFPVMFYFHLADVHVLSYLYLYAIVKYTCISHVIHMSNSAPEINY